MQNETKNTLSVLPARIASALNGIDTVYRVEEIRLRVGRIPQIVTSEGELMLDISPFTPNEAHELLERLCKYSVYACADELRQGFITLDCGSRVGLCGKPVLDNGRISMLTDVSGFNIRIAAEMLGCAEPFIACFLRYGEPVSTLIASPPGGGKTTLLRDTARCLSNGIGMVRGVKTAIADERNEIAGMVRGVPTFDVGMRTDVMQSVPKAESIMMLIRNMSPRVIITDEIGCVADAGAIAEASRCGVAVIASAHAGSIEELMRRECTEKLLSERVFERIMLLKRHGSSLSTKVVDL